MSILRTNRLSMIWLCGVSVLGAAGCNAPAQPAPILNESTQSDAGSFAGPISVVIARTVQPSAQATHSARASQVSTSGVTPVVVQPLGSMGSSGSVRAASEQHAGEQPAATPPVVVEDTVSDGAVAVSGGVTAPSTSVRAAAPASTPSGAEPAAVAAPVAPEVPAVPEVATPTTPTAPAAPTPIDHVGHVDMMDLVLGLETKSFAALDVAAINVANRHRDEACAQLAEVVGVTEMITQLRRNLFPTEQNWEFVFQPLVSKAQESFVGFCNEASPQHHDTAYFEASINARHGNSLRSRIASSTATANAQIPVLENSPNLDRALILSAARVAIYTSESLVREGSSEAICHSAAKTLGALRGWYSVVFDNNNGYELLGAPSVFIPARWEAGVQGRLTDAYRLTRNAVQTSCTGADRELSRQAILDSSTKLVEVERYLSESH